MVAEPEEMSITADASKGQCQFNLHSVALQPSVNAQGIFLLRTSHFIFKYQRVADSRASNTPSATFFLESRVDGARL